MKSAGKRMELKTIIPTEVTQSQEDKYRTFSCMWMLALNWLPAYQRSWRASKGGEMERSGTEEEWNNEELAF